MPVTVKNDLKNKLNDNCIFHWMNYDFYPNFLFNAAGLHYGDQTKQKAWLYILQYQKILEKIVIKIYVY